MVTEAIGKNKAGKKIPKKNFGINIGSNAGSLAEGKVVRPTLASGRPNTLKT